MAGLKDHEIQAIHLLTAGVFSPEQREAIIRDAKVTNYEYTGSGYFLTLRHPSFPQNRTVCNRPLIMGRYDKEQCGFVIFLENGELLFECHTWGEVDLSESFREMNVQIGTAA